MTTIGKMRRYLPARNLDSIATDGTGLIRLTQDRGGVFMPSGMVIYYKKGLETCLLEMETIEGIDIFTSPVYLSDIGTARGDSPEGRIWALEGVVLVSGNHVDVRVSGNGSAIGAGEVSILLVGDYSSDGG